MVPKRHEQALRPSQQGIQMSGSRPTGEGVRLRYCYVLGGAYLLLAILYVLMLFAQIGHGSNPFDFVFYLILPACRLLDLLPAFVKAKSPLLLILSCLLAGVIQFALIGCVIDVVVSRFRKP